MSELKPGGLALVVGSISTPENIGKIVTIVERTTSACGTECWVVGGNGLVSAKVDDGVYVGNYPNPYALFLSEHLLPINPEPDQLHTTKEEALTCPTN